MKRIFSILFAVVLALSLTLVPAAPAMAQPTEREFLDQTRLAKAGGGTAEWVTTLPGTAEVYNGDFAAHMAVPADGDISNIIHMGIQGVSPLPLSEITTVKFWEYLVALGGSGAGMGGSAAIILFLNDPGTDPPAEGTNPPEWGEVEDAITFHTYGTWATQDAWSLRDLLVVGQDWQGYADSIGDTTVEPLSYWLDSNNWANADWEVCFISVVVGAGNWAGYEGYIDDFIVEWTGSDYEDTYLTDPRVVNETQNTGHNYIQNAIDAANPGDTIIVAAGIYVEKVKIMDKSLTLLGAQADVPIVDGERTGDESIIRGKVNWRGYPVWWSLIYIQHSDVVVNGFTIEKGKRGFAIQGPGEGISNILVSYNYIENNGKYSYEAGIFRDDAAVDVTITHNYIASNPIGIATRGGATTITDNTFYGNGKGIDFKHGDPTSTYFPDYDQPNYPTIISGNTFTNDRTSIKLSLRGHQSIAITGNDITEARTVAIETSGWGEDLVNPAIHYNKISDNEFGINNQVTEINLDAIYNWWGDCSGPYHSTNTSGTGDEVSDDVDYDPWLGKSLSELRDAIADDLDDEDFKREPDDRRAALLSKIDDVCDQYGDGAYRGALNKLQRDIAKRIEKWIEEDAITAWELMTKVNAEIDILEGFVP